ncbi:hypothetical protein OG892_01655 [Streptomyces sp. NBC_00341]|uniref:hypothetical protein n=1 Tax=Streptomyces sp. NBC_00341 TaxID=2975717 RepID=UPI00308967BA|nr:hypothetical protein OG892_01655 [Streptomyces sp. NBC_00341]
MADNGSNPEAILPSSAGDQQYNAGRRPGNSLIKPQQQIKGGNANSYNPNTGLSGIANKNDFHDNKIAALLFSPN